MEFPFYLTEALKPDSEGFALLHSKNYYNKTTALTTSASFYSNQSTTTVAKEFQKVATVIDKMGEASSKAQNLKATITSFSRFAASDNQRLYLKVEGKKVLGLLKVGERTLFYHDYQGSVKELTPLCVLDFYVHESVQRNGIGKELFEYMLFKERTEPRKLAYDRPSPKLISFLRKHYNLVKYHPQNNNFVIYNQYFESKGSDPAPSRQAKDNVSMASTKPKLFESSQMKAGPKSNASGSFYYDRTSEVGDYDDAQSVTSTTSIRSHKILNVDHDIFGTKSLVTRQYNNDKEENKAGSKKKIIRNENEFKVAKETYDLNDVQQKIEHTQKQINDYQKKIGELDKAKKNLATKDERSRGVLQAPWAANLHGLKNSSTSKAYGEHYFQSK